MNIKEHTRNQKRMYRIHKMEEQIEKDKYIIGSQQQEIERLKNGIKELDNMFYETFRISQKGYYSISEWELKDFTDKLKELKEGR